MVQFVTESVSREGQVLRHIFYVIGVEYRRYARQLGQGILVWGGFYARNLVERRGRYGVRFIGALAVRGRRYDACGETVTGALW